MHQYKFIGGIVFIAIMLISIIGEAISLIKKKDIELISFKARKVMLAVQAICCITLTYLFFIG